MKKIITIGIVILLIGFISGCLEDRPSVKYTQGLLIEVTQPYSTLSKTNFIFDDDSVFQCWTDYNITYLKSLIGKEIKIRYYENFGNNLIDIETL
jgi:hypothetical protein